MECGERVFSVVWKQKPMMRNEEPPFFLRAVLSSLGVHGAVICLLILSPGIRRTPVSVPRLFEVIWEKREEAPDLKRCPVQRAQPQPQSLKKPRGASQPPRLRGDDRKVMIRSVPFENKGEASAASKEPPPRQTSTPLPSYPWACRKRCQEGRVILSLSLTPEGQVKGADIQESSGYSLLDEAALEGVKHWVLGEGESQRIVTIVFRLRGESMSFFKNS